MYKPGRVPFDPSQVSPYLQVELGKISGEIDGFETKQVVPVWTASGTDPVLGNGSLLMRYKLSNDFCELWLRLIAGSTTTFGTGEWEFQLPINAREFSQFGLAHMLDSGTNRYSGNCEAANSGNILRVYAHGSLTSVRNTVPFTWATNDELHAHIRYLCKLDT